MKALRIKEHCPPHWISDRKPFCQRVPLAGDPPEGEILVGRCDQDKPVRIIASEWVNPKTIEKHPGTLEIEDSLFAEQLAEEYPDFFSIEEIEI